MSLQKLDIDVEYLTRTLGQLLNIPSPTGFTDSIVRFVAEELTRLGVPAELTRRGAIRADLAGRQSSPDRALVAHLDTTGAMVKTIDDDGRLGVVPVGQWSSRFAEGARVTVVSDDSALPGTIVPLKDSGHAYDDDVDRLPVSWSNVEVRVDAPCDSRQAARDLGIRVGDYVTIDPRSEFLANGYVNSRHLDDKAGVATLLAMARAVVTSSVTLPVDCHLLFTISEEVGSGASHVLHGDVAEMVAIDNGVVGPEQNTSARGVTLCMMDSSGPFDYHLTRKLIALCEDLGIEHERDIFTHYRCDAASAVDAGNDLRTALVCYGLDASHGHERVHLDSLRRVAELLAAYVQSPPTFTRDQHELAPIKQGFSRQPDASPDVPAAPVEEEA